MAISNILSRISSDGFRLPLLKMLFRKNGLQLDYFKSIQNNRFFIYQVDDVYIGSEIINWFINTRLLEQNCSAASMHCYKPKSGDIVIDLGAGLGEETIVYSRAVGPSGKVFAVEANPMVYEVLKEIVDRNKLSNVEALNIALSAGVGVVTINDNHGSYQSASLIRTNITINDYNVEGMPLSHLIQQFGIEKVDLLKVNIEGAERFLTLEVQPEIFDKVRNIAIECHDFRYKTEGPEFFRTKELIRSYFSRLGFLLQSQVTGNVDIDDWVYGARM